MPANSILIVDDEESVVVTMQAILEMDGYDVTSTMKGTEAIELLRQRQFDLVLSDLRLDDLDGIQILAEVRRTSPETITIILTGYASLESAVNALREGAYDYLLKPADVEELRATVARAMERREVGLQLRARVRDLERANATIADLNRGLQTRVDEATSALQLRLNDLAKAKAEISDLYREAQRHVEQLRELDRLKSQFLSIASHELKTPITAMSGFLQIAIRRMKRRAEKGAPEPQEWAQEHRSAMEQLEVVQRQTGKLSRLVDELLDVSRIESGRLEFRIAPIDVRELADEVVGRMQLTSPAHPMTVRSSSQNGALITADRDHIEQVLNNLIANAVKYSPAGGAVEVAVEPDENEVTISVRDEGIGIPKEELEQVFGLFYRSPDREARDVGGMGLGLYISKEIVERHGGRIWVESEPRKGSTFYVTLPRVAAPPEGVRLAPPDPAVASPPA